MLGIVYAVEMVMWNAKAHFIDCLMNGHFTLESRTQQQEPVVQLHNSPVN